MIIEKKTVIKGWSNNFSVCYFSLKIEIDFHWKSSLLSLLLFKPFSSSHYYFKRLMAKRNFFFLSVCDWKKFANQRLTIFYDHLNTLQFSNLFTLKKKARSRRNPTETISDADYVDDRALLANTASHVESLQHSLEKAARGIGLYLNSD